MPKPFARAFEKFADAEYRLAVGEGDVRSRLRAAYTILSRLQANDLPSEHVADWEWIMNELIRFGPELSPGGEVWKTALDHTLSRIRNATGRKIAERIHAIYRNLVFIRERN